MHRGGAQEACNKACTRQERRPVVHEPVVHKRAAPAAQWVAAAAFEPRPRLRWSNFILNTRYAPSAVWCDALKSRSSKPRMLRSEEHTSELQSLMRSSYAVFCLKKKKIITSYTT